MEDRTPNATDLAMKSQRGRISSQNPSFREADFTGLGNQAAVVGVLGYDLPCWFWAAHKIMATQIATIIIGVLVIGLILGYGLWWAAKSADRTSHDPRYRRRVLIRGAVVYIVVGVFIIVGVATRKERVEALYGLPFGAIIAWLLLRTAIKTKVPPGQ